LRKLGWGSTWESTWESTQDQSRPAQKTQFRKIEPSARLNQQERGIEPRLRRHFAEILQKLGRNLAAMSW
jgi:hypothetical protein